VKLGGGYAQSCSIHIVGEAGAKDGGSDRAVSSDGGASSPRYAALTCGTFSYRTSSLVAGLKRALVLLYGHGTSATLSNLVVTPPQTSSTRCEDPTAWYRHLARGEPVVAASQTGAGGDLEEASHPTVVYHPPTKQYLMFFDGRTIATSTVNALSGIFLARSTDGVEWQVEKGGSGSPTPVLASNTSSQIAYSSPSVLYDSTTKLLRLWMTRAETGNPTIKGIAYATSKEGTSWTLVSGSSGPYVFSAEVTGWDSYSVEAPSVLVRPDKNYLLYYTGSGNKTTSKPAIGVATSTNGVHWTRPKTRQPIISISSTDSGLACNDPMVVYDPVRALYHLWYSYSAFGQNPAIRYAVSQDSEGLTFTSWTRTITVLDQGQAGSFDDHGVLAPAALLEADPLSSSDTIVRLYYVGVGKDAQEQIGYAVNRGAL
jgi:hypothetical protein